MLVWLTFSVVCDVISVVAELMVSGVRDAGLVNLQCCDAIDELLGKIAGHHTHPRGMPHDHHTHPRGMV